MVSIWTREGFNYKLRLRRKYVLFVDNVGRDEVDFLGESVDYENILILFSRRLRFVSLGSLPRLFLRRVVRELLLREI